MSGSDRLGAEASDGRRCLGASRAHIARHSPNPSTDDNDGLGPKLMSADIVAEDGHAAPLRAALVTAHHLIFHAYKLMLETGIHIG
jgi:hypothetical protein